MLSNREKAAIYSRLAELSLEMAQLEQDIENDTGIITRTVSTRRGVGRPSKNISTKAVSTKANPTVTKIQTWLSEHKRTEFKTGELLKIAPRPQVTAALKFMKEHGLVNPAGFGRYSTANVAHA